jgi:hypothetical protein
LKQVFTVFFALYPRRRNPASSVVCTPVTRESVAVLQRIVVTLGYPFVVNGARDTARCRVLPEDCRLVVNQYGLVEGAGHADAGEENLADAYDAMFARRHKLRLQREDRESEQQRQVAIARRLAR